MRLGVWLPLDRHPGLDRAVLRAGDRPATILHRRRHRREPRYLDIPQSLRGRQICETFCHACFFCPMHC